MHDQEPSDHIGICITHATGTRFTRDDISTRPARGRFGETCRSGGNELQRGTTGGGYPYDIELYRLSLTSSFWISMISPSLYLSTGLFSTTKLRPAMRRRDPIFHTWQPIIASGSLSDRLSCSTNRQCGFLKIGTP